MMIPYGHCQVEQRQPGQFTRSSLMLLERISWKYDDAIREAIILPLSGVWAE